jgi:hypothetical protein
VTDMKRLFLIAVSLALVIYGWLQIRDFAWTPSNAPRWNPLAIKESGLGRTLARALTEQANTSFHHGLFERKPPLSTNPLSRWVDAGTAALGFEGRLHYRPIDQYPLRPYEVKQALDQVEKNLRLAFELDPGNYTAYDVYQFFLTNEVNQTEFASLAGAQLKDDDEADDTGTTQPNKLPAGPVAETPPGDSVAPGAAVHGSGKTGGPTGALQSWAEHERQRRHTRAIEITDEAIRKFRPNTMDPERFMTAAVMWYNRFMLLAPDPAELRKSAHARKKYEEVGPATLVKMKFYISAAKTCQQDLEKKGLWQAIPERRLEYLRVMQLISRCAFALSVAVQNNREQMALDQKGPTVWGPLGRS